MVIGQNPMAPKKPTMSLKNGIAIARTVVVATKKVLQVIIKMFMLTLNLPPSCRVFDELMRYGYRLARHDSTIENIG